MHTKTKPGDRREHVKILAAATRGAIDRYFELFLDELDLLNRALQHAERWADRGGGKLPAAATRYERLAKLAYETPSRCRRCERCEQCSAKRELGGWSSFGLAAPIQQVFDLMVGRRSDLDGALEQLQSTFMDLTQNALLTEVVMAHAFARAGYAPRAAPRAPALVDMHVSLTHARRKAQPAHGVGAGRRSALRVLEGGKSKRAAAPVDTAKS